MAFASLPRFRVATIALLLAPLALAGCGGGLDPGYSGRSARFATAAPPARPKRDPDYLAYAVPETELGNYPASRSAEFEVHGVDVSKYQGEIDWQAVKDSGVAFAFIKASEGADNVDSKFQRNWAAAKVRK